MGLVMPTPQMVNYLTVRPHADGRLAAKNLRQELFVAPTSEQLVSASPEADQELAAPTPSQPIVEEQVTPEVAVGPTGAVGPAAGATGPTGTPGG
jgi:hypothetical protein